GCQGADRRGPIVEERTRDRTAPSDDREADRLGTDAANGPHPGRARRRPAPGADRGAPSARPGRRRRRGRSPWAAAPTDGTGRRHRPAREPYRPASAAERGEAAGVRGRARRPASEAERAADDLAHDLVRAAVDPLDAGVAPHPRDLVLLHVAVAAVDLDAGVD